MTLTEIEIKKRLAKLKNYERLYPQLRKVYDELKQENLILKMALEEERLERRDEVEMLKLQIEDLRKIVFGKNKRDDDDRGTGGSGSSISEETKTKRTERSNESYRRAVPLDEKITDEKYYSIDCCPKCKNLLSNLKEVIRYKEDIILPVFIGEKIEKQHIETGFCAHCRKCFSSIPISKQVCFLGENVRMRIIHASTVLGMTLGKIGGDLKDAFGIEVSDGEMINILEREKMELLPEYNAIDSRIRGAPAVHVDETSCPVQKEELGEWAWVKTATNSFDTIFHLGQSRGKGNVVALCNEPNQIVVTDDYGAYDFLGPLQALCWAHPLRKFRDLAKSKILFGNGKITCRRFYERFCTLMNDVKKVVDSPYERINRKQKARIFEKRIKKLFKAKSTDPKKLATLKQTFYERRKAYLTCVKEKNVPMTNNKAERALRGLVIKRKLSFGHKTQKGADIMSVLMSVCFTLWWGCQEKRENFYQAYRQIKQQSPAS